MGSTFLIMGGLEENFGPVSQETGPNFHYTTPAAFLSRGNIAQTLINKIPAICATFFIDILKKYIILYLQGKENK